MRKVFHKTRVKVLAILLCSISILVLIASCVGMIGFGILTSEEAETDIYGNKRYDLNTIINSNLSKNYAAYLFDHVMPLSDTTDTTEDDNWSWLNGGNLLYTVTRDNKVVYSNNNETVNSKDYDYTFFGSYSDNYYYSTNNFLKAILNPGVRYESATGLSNTEEILAVVTRDNDPRLYFETENYFFPINSFELFTKDGNSSFCYWESGKEQYNEQNYFWEMEDLGKANWERIVFDYDCYCEAETNDGSFTLTNLSQEEFDKKPVFTSSFVQSVDYVEYEMADEVHYPEYQIYMRVKNPLNQGLYMECGNADYFYDADHMISWLKKIRGMLLPIQVGSLIISIALIIMITMGAGHRTEDDEIHLRFWDRIPYFFIVCITGGLVTLGIMGNYGVLFLYQMLSLSVLIVLEIEITIGWLMVLFAFYLSTVTRIKAQRFWRNTLLYYICLPFRKTGNAIATACKNMKETARQNTSLVTKTILILVVLGLLQLFVIVGTGYSPRQEVWLFLIYKVVETLVVIWGILQMERIKQGGKRVAQGEYNQPIDTNGMYWEFKKHAENINDVGDGISIAVEDRMKSEHFRTELITNVSHDIKTPLTSIINYVDLMKKENIENPAVLEYMDVLDRQSARLKKLIEDLMEASKASTGNLKVNLEQFDATVLLTQVVGEFEEKTAASGLELIVQGTEKPVYIMADGRHLYRVFDNLLSNVCKYAQPSTRVYINLGESEDNVTITFRNISKYQLNITSEELMERFVRGDSSRNTEGNGLGLSIAQSLMLLMNGTLQLDIDGDLFKATLSFPKV